MLLLYLKKIDFIKYKKLLFIILHHYSKEKKQLLSLTHNKLMRYASLVFNFY